MDQKFAEKFNFQDGIIEYHGFHANLTKTHDNFYEFIGYFTFLGETFDENFILYKDDSKLRAGNETLISYSLKNFDKIDFDDVDYVMLHAIGIHPYDFSIDNEKIEIRCRSINFYSNPEEFLKESLDLDRIKSNINILRNSKQEIDHILSLFNSKIFKINIVKDYVEYDMGGSDGYGSGGFTIDNIREWILGELKCYLNMHHYEIGKLKSLNGLNSAKEIEEICLLPQSPFNCEIQYDCGYPDFMNGSSCEINFDYEIFDGVKVSDIFGEHYPELIFPIDGTLERTESLVEKYTLPNRELWTAERQYLTKEY